MRQIPIEGVQIWLPDTGATLRVVRLNPAIIDRDHAYAVATQHAQRQVRDWNASQQFPGRKIALRDWPIV